jgi:hypothetical protein
MNERDIELAKQVYGTAATKQELQFAALIRADERERIKVANAPEIERINAHLKSLEDAVQAERKHLEAELLKLKDGIAASSDYIQGRWDLIGEFQDVIRARGKA